MRGEGLLDTMKEISSKNSWARGGYYVYSLPGQETYVLNLTSLVHENSLELTSGRSKHEYQKKANWRYIRQGGYLGFGWFLVVFLGSFGLVIALYIFVTYLSIQW